MIIQADGLDHQALNDILRRNPGDCRIEGCCGQRFIAVGMKDQNITVAGIPGNALGAYLNGASITVCSNAQDAVGDTMNDGRIIIRYARRQDLCKRQCGLPCRHSYEIV